VSLELLKASLLCDHIIISSHYFPLPVVPTVVGNGRGGAWVGIDGNNDQSQSALQSGVDWIVTKGRAQYFAYIQWAPGPVIHVKNFVLSPGDVVTFNVQVTSPVTATITMENSKTRAKVVKNVKAPSQEVGVGLLIQFFCGLKTLLDRMLSYVSMPSGSYRESMRTKKEHTFPFPTGEPSSK
jgi:hypothetical protein